MDSDNNDVRDDVDRMIACNVVTENDYYQNILIAKVKQKRLTTPTYTQEMFESDSQDIHCIMVRNTEDNTSDLEYLIKKLTFNTPERLAKVKQDEINIHGMMLGGGDSSCPTATSYGLR